MTKNTKANLTLIFSINKKNADLTKALDSIARQTDKNCNLIFVFNGCNQSDKEIFKTFDWKSFNHVDYILISENLGDSYAQNYAIAHNLTTKYFYFFNSNMNLMPDFVSVVNNFLTQHTDTDVLSVFGIPNIYFKDEYIKVHDLSDDFCNRPLICFYNQILNIEYINRNKIKTKLFKHYPLLYYVELAEHNPTWYSLGRQVCNMSSKPSYSYNVMDLFDQCQGLVNRLNDKWYKSKYSQIEYLCLVTLFRNFTYAMFSKNRTNFILQKRVLNKIKNFIDDNFINWHRNEWLYSKKNKNDPTYLDYLRGFKPKLIHVLRALYSELFTQGHAKHK